MRLPNTQTNAPEADKLDLAQYAALASDLESPFCCVKCNCPELNEGNTELVCQNCGFSFPIIFGVPLLVDNFDLFDCAHELTDEAAKKVCSALGLDSNPGVIERLRSILTKNYQIGDLAQSAENNYFLTRVFKGASQKQLSEKELVSGIPVNEDVQYSFDLHYIPKNLPRSKEVTHNVRFTNCGNSIISSVVENPVCLCYQLIDSKGRTTYGRRTKLPIELLPGRSLTVPMVIHTPRRPGKYELVVQFVHENVSWLEQDALRLAVEVCKKPQAEPWQSWNLTKVDHGGYGPDHDAGKKLLAKQIQLQDNPRVLEIGGCCNPMMRGICEDLHCVDIDMQTLQVGQLVAEQQGTPVRYVCADGNQLPYHPGTFDWIIMFSTLHHFADPGQVLGNLKRYLKPHGRIATMCEPIGHYIDGVVYDEFIEELKQGINEQTFSLEEYHSIIQRAQLSIDQAIVDVGSLKLILKS